MFSDGNQSTAPRPSRRTALASQNEARQADAIETSDSSLYRGLAPKRNPESAIFFPVFPTARRELSVPFRYPSGPIGGMMYLGI
jgi:hypothetical protein